MLTAHSPEGSTELIGLGMMRSEPVFQLSSTVTYLPSLQSLNAQSPSSQGSQWNIAASWKFQQVVWLMGM